MCIPVSFSHPLVCFIIHSQAMKGPLDQECDVDDEWLSPECMAYTVAKEDLEKAMNAPSIYEHELIMDRLKSIVTNVRNVKLLGTQRQDDLISGAEEASEDYSAATKEVAAKLRSAVEDAKAVTAETGIRSREAKLAWETVEEIASSGRDRVIAGMLTQEECLLDATNEACEALEELSRLIEN